jgi:hypothetical protein
MLFALPTFTSRRVVGAISFTPRVRRRAARPAANSSIRFVWITPRAFCIAGRHWEQASLSARSPTPVAFATTLISRENFAIGSATRQAVAPMHPVAFRQINKDDPRTHHDALEFPDGQIVLLTDVFEGQEATVLQLPAQPATAAEAEAQERVAHVG